MKRHGNLFERIIDFKNLYHASKKAMRGKRFNRKQAAFYFHLEDELCFLQKELLSGTYKPMPYTTFEIREPKVRKICAADFRDRVVHHAICNILDPIFERKFIFDTYACRKFKGSHKAIKRLQKFSQKYNYFLKCDIQKYFESIDHEKLKSLLRKILKDQRIISLLNQIVDHAVPGNAPGKGLPIGNLTSQYFSNLYLSELDHFAKENLRIKGYVRYMDDMIFLSNEKEVLSNTLSKIRIFLSENLKLFLKEKVTQIGPVTYGIPFLGFRVFPNTIRLKRANLIRWRRKIKKKEEKFINGKINEEKLALCVRSMMAHITHANSMNLRRKELQICFS